MAIKFFFFIRRLLNNRNAFIKIFSPFLIIPYRIINLIYGATVPLNVVFEGKPILPHGFHGVFISKNTIIGKNVTIYQQVTIGSINTPNSKHPGSPKIGNNVLIGVGAKVLGGISIGDNVNIGANAVVINNIPSNSSVVNMPVRVISKNS